MTGFVAKTPPEGVNLPKEHPLKEFAWLLAAVVAGIAFVMLVGGFLVDRWVSGLTDEEEAELSGWLPGDFLGKGGGKPGATEALVELSNALSKTANRSPYDTRIICSNVPNAFALPGRRIRVTSGFLDDASSENEIAMVLAHEMGHIDGRHHLRAMGRALIVALPLSLLLGNNAAAQFLQSTTNMVQLRHNRAQESESDAKGLARLSQHYGHLGGATSFFQRVHEKRKDQTIQIPAFATTHPGDLERIAAIEALANRNGWKLTGELRAVPEVLRNACD